MELDDKAWKMLTALQRDGRISLKALAEQVGLSLPATSERLKRLEDSGIIQGYSAKLNLPRLGYSIQAVIGITTPQPHKAAFIALLRNLPQVLECLHVTGQDSFLLRVIAKDMSALEQLISQINHFGETRTSIVMSTPIDRRDITKSL